MSEKNCQNCANCRFWSQANTIEGWDSDPVEGDASSVELPHGKCFAIIHGNASGVSNLSKTPAMVCDGSGYAATFWTLPTFSCALWVEKRTDE